HSMTTTYQITRRTPISTLFPYTTLFRSVKDQIVEIQTDMLLGFGEFCIIDSFLVFNEYASKESKGIHLFNKNTFDYITSTGYLRSEEHTSELQSRENLVCRLLLEKKKKK